ncbi:hypothetical protein [Shewanella sp. S23-S33]|uniref:hypothetical protein n=1 Tax=Shewanella sp. S23-S33 TaxID=3342769 RepID=UPI00372D597D
MELQILETQWDFRTDTLGFSVSDENGKFYNCGVTRIAINDYYDTNDSIEQAEINFDENQDYILDLASNLIVNGQANERGHYIITSDIIGV